MNQTTNQTRRRSYDAVLPKRAARCRLILETLGNRELTASEITEDDLRDGEEQLQNITDDYVKQAETAAKKKEQEVLSI